MTPTDIAWAAGLLEGEGTFRYQYKQGTYAAFNIAMGSRDKDVIDRMLALVPGSRGHVTDLNGTPFYHWVLGRADCVIPFLNTIYPYMGTRRRNAIAEAIWDWWNTPVGNKDKTHCKNGHEFTPENTIKNPCDEGRRRCRICTTEARRRAEAVRRSKDRGAYA